MITSGEVEVIFILSIQDGDTMAALLPSCNKLEGLKEVRYAAGWLVYFAFRSYRYRKITPGPAK